MQRREVLQGIGCSAGLALLPRTVQAQSGRYTNWHTPNVAPYSGTDEQALRLFKDLLDRFAVYEDFRAYALGTQPADDTLKIPYGETDVRYARMTFGSGQTLSNLIVTDADLSGPGWAGKTRATRVWIKSYPAGQRVLIVMYTWHMVCNNRSLFIGTAQGKCIWDDAICGPGCHELRRQVSS